VSDISNVLRKVIELDISLGLDGTQEALDEITRLTAEVEQNAIDLEEYRRDVERLRSVTVVQESLIRKSEAENEKLRAALEEIIQDSFSVYAIQVARAALEGKQ
jgi:hypothetical protein